MSTKAEAKRARDSHLWIRWGPVGWYCALCGVVRRGRTGDRLDVCPSRGQADHEDVTNGAGSELRGRG